MTRPRPLKYGLETESESPAHNTANVNIQQHHSLEFIHIYKNQQKSIKIMILNM